MNMLRNCYVPAAFHTSKPQATKIINPKTLRQAHIDTNVLSNAAGSAIVEMGNTKVLCSIHGPRPASGQFQEEGQLLCEVRYLPFSQLKAGISLNYSGSTPSRSSITEVHVQLSQQVRESIISSIIDLEKFTKSVVEVQVQIIQDDGCVLPACIIAASMALQDANIQLYDIVSSSTVCVIVGGGSNNGDDDVLYVVDPNARELEMSVGHVTLGLMINVGVVTYWSLSGKLPMGVSGKALEMCRVSCSTFHKMMRKASIGNNN